MSSMETVFNVEQINLLMRSRRSVFTRQFLPGKAIPDDIIMQLLDNANWAPTHKKTEPWRFVVFSGEGRQKLANFQAELYKKNAGDNFRQPKYDKLLATPVECSHVIAICMKRDPERRLPEIEEIAAVACAVENLYLSVTAYGLGGYWSTGGVTYEEEAKPFFGLEPEDKLLGFFYLGYVQTPSEKAARKPVEEKVTWVKE